VERSVARRNVTGGTAPAQVERQIKRAGEVVADLQRKLAPSSRRHR
jgi:argininosuccinate lyase